MEEEDAWTSHSSEIPGRSCGENSRCEETNSTAGSYRSNVGSRVRPRSKKLRHARSREAVHSKGGGHGQWVPVSEKFAYGLPDAPVRSIAVGDMHVCVVVQEYTLWCYWNQVVNAGQNSVAEVCFRKFEDRRLKRKQEWRAAQEQAVADAKKEELALNEAQRVPAWWSSEDS